MAVLDKGRGNRRAFAASLELLLPATPRAPSVARNAIGGLKQALSRDGFDTLRLLVSEVVTNSVRHAGLSAGDSISLRVLQRGPTVRVEVVDAGPGFDARDRPPPSAMGGWGLYLVDKLARRWGVEGNHETRVWFELEDAG